MTLFARLVFVIALAIPGLAAAEGLFVDAPPTPAMAADGRPASMMPGTVKRQRFVGVDATYLKARTAGDTAPADGKIQTPAAAIPLPPLLLALFPDLNLQVDVTARSITTDGHLVWTGRPQDDPTGVVNLVIDGIEIVGHVEYRGTIVEIRPAAFGLHMVFEIDQAAFPSEGHAPEPPAMARPDLPQGVPQRGGDNGPLARPAPPNGQTAARAIGDTNTTLNVLVAYTSRSASASSNIAAEIQLAVTTANTVYQNSGIPITLNLVGTQLMSGYDETTRTYDQLLTDLTETSDGRLDSIHTLRTSLQADLVALFTEKTDYCGLAWLYNGYPQYGFSVVTRSCATSNLTFPHELGHNMGANHDRYVESGGETNAYNYGYADPANRIRTVMAYNDACAAQATSCTRIPYFSSPDLTYGGVALGVTPFSTAAAHNVRRLTETRTAIAQYRNGTAATYSPASGWYWNSSEAGRGYSIEIRNGAIFFAAYTYASDGTPLWYVSSGAMTSGTSYTGTLQEYRGGLTLNGGSGQATYVGSVGTLRIGFFSDTEGYITFPNGSGTYINRFDFVTNGAIGGAATGYPQTGWWWNASEAGRGYFIEAQNTSMFISFYLYNTAGQAVWYVVSGGMISPTLFQGTLQEYTGGSTLDTGSFRAPSATTSRGTVTVQFSGTTAATLTMPNGTQVPLTRFTF